MSVFDGAARGAGLNNEIANEAQDEREQNILRACLGNVRVAPPINQFSGFGFCMLGSLETPATRPSELKMYWFSAAFVPIIPICVYLVDSPRPGTYHLRARISLRDFHRVYRGRLSGFYKSILSESGASISIAAAMTLILIMFHIIIWNGFPL
jgi:hypothetical protein